MSIVEFQRFEKVMNKKIIVVPDYQRDYAWSKAELATLADDLERLYENSKNGVYRKHFIGSIVLIPLDETISKAAEGLASHDLLDGYDMRNIIDGQQRVSTISVLLIAIRDYAKNHNIELADEFSIRMILDTGKRNAEGKGIPTLHFSQENTQICYDGMLYGKASKFDQRRSGAKRLLAAKSFFDDELSRLFDNDTEAPAHLNNYVLRVLNSLQVVEIECSQDSDAFQIFESLNATGVPLTPAEQVKNLVLNKSRSKDKSLSSWEKIVEATGEDNLVEFLAQYMFCRSNHRVSRKDIYREFKEALNTVAVSEVLPEICMYADIYRQLKNPTAGIPATSVLEDLNDLGQKQAYVPLLLAAKTYGIDNKDFAKIADAILVFIVRHQVCSQSSNKLDATFSKVCEHIKNEANSADCIVDYFKNSQMDDAVFKSMFKELWFQYSATAQRKALVYLKRIEEKANGSDQPLLLQSSNLSVEHIIPKQPSIEQLEGWIGENAANELRDSDPDLSAFAERTVMSVGNLALLYRPENSSASNKSYAAKRNCYAQAVIDKDGCSRGVPKDVFSLIRELLADYPEEFTAESVEERAVKLAEKAVSAWR